MAMKDFLGFADHLAGDGGLIIDALLQHTCWNITRISSRHLENEIHFQRGSAANRVEVEYNQSFP
jgi:hypothetical protein